MERVRDPVGLRQGLTSEEAARRLADVGPNTLPTARGPSPWRELAGQFTHLLALLLIVASGLALLGGLPALAGAIAVVVVLNALFAFWQERRADRSAERLRAMMPARVRVRRDGRVHSLGAEELVPGDVVELTAGDRLAADHEVLAGRGLRVDESLVTGESEPVTHVDGDPLMAGTFVVQGEGEALVTATGPRTTLAEISHLAAEATRPPSPMSVELAGVVRVVALVACATGTALGLGGLALGLAPTSAFLFAVGVTVALVPEGLLPTVTLSLARGAQLMAHRQALVRRLDAVETLGATTFICTDKTGTVTQNRMSVVTVWTPGRTVAVTGSGYEPTGIVGASEEDRRAVRRVAGAATRCVAGRVEERSGEWHAQGEPMEAAIYCAALRAGAALTSVPVLASAPYTPERMMSSVVTDEQVQTLGAPEHVLQHCSGDQAAARRALAAMTGRGLRVLAVASRPWHGETEPDALERDLELLGLLGLEDPPRPDVAGAVAACFRAGISLAMVTGDHPRTAEAVAREIGLLHAGGVVLDGRELPEDDDALGVALDRADGVVVARVTPGDKLRIARALRDRGHVVAMTGDGVNDAPALREADVGVAMGASGSDVAREAADLVLLDDHFGTIVTAVELGRATFANVRRFLTYHLTDNVAELAPFAAWALSGGQFPLAIGVLQVLALDIGTDMLPALALGAEPPSRRVMDGRGRSRTLVDRRLLLRAFGVLGPTEAAAALVAFTAVLVGGGWSWGEEPGAALLAGASGTAFATIALAQMSNAFACRSDTVPVWRSGVAGNPSLLLAVGSELGLLLVFLGVAPVAALLGGAWPSAAGWGWALAGAVALVAADALHKLLRSRRGDLRHSSATASRS
ncbi:cation-translocating P-type ATPase [Knoellia aerolata]|uniref:Haloacid dehalogenase n=1 Tax=Knoellia aerolata DSM 18566 TaxID=1385519 RepID=A0A0A0JTX8_9MICO|nr:cation-transporting P-type ATPase [Knoellia aerolata]KGN40593.1 haloacid dehalogenase [Knoellia aerolata DSM 18566]